LDIEGAFIFRNPASTPSNEELTGRAGALPADPVQRWVI